MSRYPQPPRHSRSPRTRPFRRGARPEARPGEKFDWKRLACAGIGLWVPPAPLEDDAGLGPGDEGEAVAALQRGLLEFGYGVEVTTTYGTGLAKVVEAFQRHFRTERIDGRADRSTIDTLNRLLAAVRETPIA